MQGSGYVAKFRSRSKEGLSPASQLRRLVGGAAMPRFAGVSLAAPDLTSAWAITAQIADGEYNYAGFVPRDGWKVLDIGANIGVFSLWAQKKGAVVTSYEPGISTYDCLKRNCAGRAIATHHAAVVGEPRPGGRVDLYVHDERSTRNTLVGHEIGTGRPLSEKVSVPAVPIADVMSEPVDLLKVDVEGAEFEVFEHATDEQLRRAERIVLEFHRSVGSPTVLLERLEACGFSAQILDGDSDNASFGVIGAQRR